MDSQLLVLIISIFEKKTWNKNKTISEFCSFQQTYASVLFDLLALMKLK